MNQQASVGGPREPEARASGHLSMEHAPLRRKGKGGEVPQLHRRFLLQGSRSQAEAEAFDPHGGPAQPRAFISRRRLRPSERI